MPLDNETMHRHRIAAEFLLANDEITVNAEHWTAMSAEQRAELRTLAAENGSTIANPEPEEAPDGTSAAEG